MARKGIVANEYLGHFADGKTPVTMQLMISKEDFNALSQYTSKDPLKPYVRSESQAETPKLPPHLQSFITTYLKKRIDANAGQVIDQNSVRISVNEAPATHAKQIVKSIGNARALLMGDASLGLSYFKGLNAGLDAIAKFLTIMDYSIKDSFQNTVVMDKGLNEYQNWFLNEFAPAKVKEVGQYSFWQIRSAMLAMKIAHDMKSSSMLDDEEDFEPALKDYFNHYLDDPLLKNVDKNWRPYPHRDYEPAELGLLQNVPLNHIAKKMSKIFVDFLNPTSPPIN